MLRGGVRTRGSERDGSRDRDDVDDVGASGSFKRGKQRPQAPDAAEIVRPQDFLDALRLDRREAASPRNARIVDEQVDRRVTSLHSFGQLFHRVAVTDIAALDLGVSDLLRQRLQALRAAGDEYTTPVTCRESARDRGTDAARRTRYDCDARYLLQTRTPRVAERRFPCLSVASALSRW